MNRDFFEDLGRVITSTAETVGKKTGEVVEIQRLKGQIFSMERNIEKNFQDLGKTIYEKYEKGEQLDDQSAAICEEITNRQVIISQYEGEIAGMKGQTRCSACGAVIDKDALYCNQCGSKVEADKADSKDSDSSCGCENTGDSGCGCENTEDSDCGCDCKNPEDPDCSCKKNTAEAETLADETAEAEKKDGEF